MKRYLEIETNIKLFIDEYNRNYNKNFNHLQKDIASENYCFEHAEAIIPSRKSLSLNSINSNFSKFEVFKIDDFDKSSNSNEKSKSESDFYDMIYNKNYKYYLDDTSHSHSIETDFEDVYVSESLNNDKNIEESESKKGVENSSYQDFTQSIKRLVNNSLSTVEDFFATLNNPNIDKNRHESTSSTEKNDSSSQSSSVFKFNGSQNTNNTNLITLTKPILKDQISAHEHNHINFDYRKFNSLKGKKFI